MPRPMPPSDPSPIAAAFDCKRCGHCCEGRGGIVVSHTDLERLCLHLGLTAEAFTERYGELRGGKLQVRAGDDGFCVFFVPESGCAVHGAKPDICRAWPYFRGNLVDAESFALAKDFCPGIPAEQAHADFVREGLESLAAEELTGTAQADQAGALQVADLSSAARPEPDGEISDLKRERGEWPHDA